MRAGSLEGRIAEILSVEDSGGSVETGTARRWQTRSWDYAMTRYPGTGGDAMRADERTALLEAGGAEGRGAVVGDSHAAGE